MKRERLKQTKKKPKKTTQHQSAKWSAGLLVKNEGGNDLFLPVSTGPKILLFRLKFVLPYFWTEQRDMLKSVLRRFNSLELYFRIDFFKKRLLSHYNNVIKISIVSKEIFKERWTAGAWETQTLCFQAPLIRILTSSIILQNSPELWWILSYKPVHVKAVVKLDGRKEKMSRAIQKSSS